MILEELNECIKNVRILGEIIGTCEEDEKLTLRLSFLPQSFEIQIDDNTEAHLHDQFVLTADIMLHTLERAKTKTK